MTYSVVYTDNAPGNLSIEREVLDEVDAELVDAEASCSSIEELVAGADALIVNRYTVDAELLDQAPNCRIVTRTGAGMDNVDIDAATERGILVANVPDYCVEEVATHTIALLLALGRDLVHADAAVGSGQWEAPPQWELHRLSTQTLGIIGFGTIAKEVTTRASALGLSVRAYDPRSDDEEMESMGVTPVDSLHRLLETSNIVTLHAPLTDASEGLIGPEEFAAMKSDGFLINTARGGLVDEEALQTALDEGEIAGAALDVLQQEPPAQENPLLSDDRVIVTPHIAYLSEESVVEQRRTFARNVKVAIEGGVPETVHNPEVVD